jgi:outer membrane protein assembly factor BamA
VRVAFTGDAIPANRREDLVPVSREGSADEDLLEDSTNRIEEYLRAQGYRDAAAPHTREEKNGELLITFRVSKGPLYRVATRDLEGNRSIGLDAIEPRLRLKVGLPFSGAALDADVAAIEDLYHRQGFPGARVDATEEPSAPERGTEVPVAIRFSITENVRTIVNSVRIAGNASVPEPELLPLLGLQPGHPFFVTQLAIDRDAIQLHYVNLGYEAATVESTPGLSGDGTAATSARAPRRSSASCSSSPAIRSVSPRSTRASGASPRSGCSGARGLPKSATATRPAATCWSAWRKRR